MWWCVADDARRIVRGRLCARQGQRAHARVWMGPREARPDWPGSSAVSIHVGAVVIGADGPACVRVLCAVQVSLIAGANCMVRFGDTRYIAMPSLALPRSTLFLILSVRLHCARLGIGVCTRAVLRVRAGARQLPTLRWWATPLSRAMPSPRRRSRCNWPRRSSSIIWRHVYLFCTAV